MGEDWARPVVHWEIVARDPARQAAFYRQLCHWEIGDGPIMSSAPDWVVPNRDRPVIFARASAPACRSTSRSVICGPRWPWP